MNSLFSSTVKSGLIALGLICGITAPSIAGPIMQPDLSVSAGIAAPMITPVRDGWAGGNDRRWRHYRGGYYDDGAGAAILGLGLGFGLGSMYNNYNYYDAPPPRRYYRTERLSSAHVRWCYNRYRSYRAWDNTFQPYGGPRQQCWSPYS